MKTSHITAAMDFTITADGLLEIPDDVYEKLVQRNSILDVYNVDKEPLGRGKYATVCRATHKITGKQYAAKFMKKRRRNADQQREIRHEMAVLLSMAGCGRVVQLHEVYERLAEVVLVLELAVGGELQRAIDEDHCLSEVDARRAMRQILAGVQDLHARNIAHLDLKPQNLLLIEKGRCDVVKLCDFGISRVLAPGIKVREILGTVDYVAPEVLHYEPISLATDVWSTGVLAYVLLSGYSPFGADDKQTTFLNISQCSLTFEPEHFSSVSGTAVDFIKCCLIIDPRKRPKINELMEHPWISNTVNIPLPVTLASTPSDSSPSPKSPSPLVQRRSLSCLACASSSVVTGTRKTPFCGADTLNGSLAESTVRTLSCLCPPGGPVCRRPHSPKTAIAIDRGILC